jgi:adenine deaminase
MKGQTTKNLVALEHGIMVARGQQPADLVVRGANLLNVLSGEIYQTDIAIYNGRVVGLGHYDGREVFEANGLYAAPGFMDAHIHLESSCLTVPEFARAAVSMGTTTAIADPHEIANVLGLEGLRYMLESSKGLPLNIFYMLPSCVPATELETSGARLDAADLTPLLDHPQILGLAELMNYPGVLAKDPRVLAKINVARGKFVDGHAPGLRGHDLCAYIGSGIRTDHECTTLEEALEKLRLGMSILIREGSVAKNMKELLPTVNSQNAHRFCLVSDDRYPTDLVSEGHLNAILRKAVALGLSPITAIQMVTINPATFYSLKDLGALAPGYRADLVLLEDLQNFRAVTVFKDGQKVAQNGQVIIDIPKPSPPPDHTLRINWDRFPGFSILAPGKGQRLGRIIEIVPDQILTRELVLPLLIQNGCAVADPSRDLAKLAVVERHKGTGNVGLGFVRGLGIREGCIATSVAHDSHNVVIAGVNDADMHVALKAIERMGGGLVAARNGAVMASTPLPIAGLLSDLPLEEVVGQVSRTLAAARELGSPLSNPFMTLSFLALPVIPELKLSDRGLVEVNRGALVPLLIN